VKDNILEESGYFWWSDVPVPQSQFAPDTAVVGKLTIDHEGRTRLELHGVLPNKHGPMAAFSDDGTSLLVDKGIHGVLKNSNKSIRMSELHRNGGEFKSNGISYERYLALHCLVCEGHFQETADPPKFARLEVEMKGFEEWLRLGGITTERTESNITARYEGAEDISYPLDGGRLQFHYGIAGPYPGTHRSSELTLAEFVAIRFIPEISVPLEEMKNQYGMLADLFILLTGSDYNLGWPTLSVGKGQERFRLYFVRPQSSASEPLGWHECWTNFVQLREKFGDIVSTWRKRRGELGPGIYLYLATRRSMPLYEEHRFVMLVWGLESLHRRRTGEFDGPHPSQEKIDRIMSQIAKSDDRHWLKGQLKKLVVEPSLEQRIFETFQGLPLDLDEEPMRKFAKECADKRNDISHYGGQRHDANYGDTVKDLHQKSEALSYLYHVLLLHEIGIDEKILQFNVYRGFFSPRIKSAFVDVGLLSPSALKDPAAEAASAAATKARTKSEETVKGDDTAL
jgi:hypothetical protein